jgi:5S rRNA maturation endonuclease (ribonuclease M5)
MTYEAFISRFQKRTKTSKGTMVQCPSHADSTASLSICPARDGGVLLKCFAGCPPEQVVGALGLEMKDLFAKTTDRQFSVPAARNANGSHHPEEKPVIEKIYQYHDELGGEVYQVVRLKPKSFRQRHDENGQWVWNMDGVDRVLYRLPEILKQSEIWIVEGEKDADNLSSLGLSATCNVGGSGKWMDGYTDSLKDKNIILCGDTDEPGKKHVKLVFDSVAGHARSVRIVNLPSSSKDVSDFIQSLGQESAKNALLQMRDESAPHVKGIKLPLFSMADLESRYSRYASAFKENSFDLGKWLPTLGLHIRPLVGGELCFIIGDTGTGKTGILQTIAAKALPLPTLLFEMELPPELLFERFVASMSDQTCRFVEEAYRAGDTLSHLLEGKFPNLLICTESKLGLKELETYITRSELRFGQRPKLVLVDYIQLMQSQSQNRRERISDIAEGLKVLAKQTQTIIIVTSQVSRPSEEKPKPTLHSAKESGSIESSCGLLLGAWREGDALKIQVLKSTKGGAGLIVTCNFDGARMKITEQGKEL